MASLSSRKKKKLGMGELADRMVRRKRKKGEKGEGGVKERRIEGLENVELGSAARSAGHATRDAARQPIKPSETTLGPRQPEVLRGQGGSQNARGGTTHDPHSR